jgi:hypothetical protein
MESLYSLRACNVRRKEVKEGSGYFKKPKKIIEIVKKN